MYNIVVLKPWEYHSKDMHNVISSYSPGISENLYQF